MNKQNKRQKRHYKIRKYLAGTSQKPRLAVFRSDKHIYAQIIDDERGKTIVADSDLKTTKKGPKVEMAFEVGKNIAKKALKKGIKKVVFDRGGFLYHGRIEKVALGAREGGLEF